AAVSHVHPGDLSLDGKGDLVGEGELQAQHLAGNGGAIRDREQAAHTDVGDRQQLPIEHACRALYVVSVAGVHRVTRPTLNKEEKVQKLYEPSGGRGKGNLRI